MIDYKVGGEYRTRGGWKARVIKNDNCIYAPFLVMHDVKDLSAWHRSDGSAYSESSNAYDLIGLWSEEVPEAEPAPSATPFTLDDALQSISDHAATYGIILTSLTGQTQNGAYIGMEWGDE